MLSLVSSGVGISTSRTAPAPHVPTGSTQAFGRRMVVRLEILVVVEIAVALEQSEAAGILVGKRGDRAAGRD